MVPTIELSKDTCQEGRFWLQLLETESETDPNYRLPDGLRAHEGELELLLTKVFGSRPCLPENMDLARQMYLNWRLSKCHKLGISAEV